MKLILLALLLSILPLLAPSNAVAQMKGLSLSGPRLEPSATPTPSVEPPSALVQPQQIHRQPIPLVWKLAILAFLFLVGIISLGFAIRAWSTSNLFDRQYRFPPNENPALRFGATKSGGCMATIAFSDDSPPERDSTSEDS